MVMDDRGRHVASADVSLVIDEERRSAHGLGAIDISLTADVDYPRTDAARSDFLAAEVDGDLVARLSDSR